MNRKQKITVAGIVTVAILAVIASMLGNRGGWTKGRSDNRLEHYPGYLDYSQGSNDPALSDLKQRGAKALQDGDTATAEAIYRERVAKYPNDPSSYTALGTVLYFQKKYAEARAMDEQALKLDPNYADAHYGLGCIAFETRLYPEARDHLERALAIRGNERGYHRVLAFVYDKLGDDAKALLHYERADALRGNMPEDMYVKQRISELKR